MKSTIIFILSISLTIASCRKNFEPSTAIDENSALTSPADIETATIGTYAVLRSPNYVRSSHFLTEYPADEVAQGQNSSDDLSRCYRYNHLTTGAHAASIWTQAYFVIGAANKIIASVADDANAALLQLKGENLYLRAMMHFNLVRVFGRPYTQGNGSNPGIPLLLETLTDAEKLTVGRSTVGDVYKSIIADLLRAETFLTVAKDNAFASKEVVQALLSRVYLYMGDNQNSIKYADLVISSGRYQLLTGSAYSGYFRAEPAGNKETIFAIRHTKTQDQNFSAIGSMYYSGDVNGNAGNKGVSGWGEIYASKKYYDFLSLNPGDLRLNFISPYRVNGVLQNNTSLTPATPMYYLTKYNFQENIINLSSPVYLRLAEMYLNKAEANAKLGNAQLALDDVNRIRSRAGLSGPALHTIASVGAAGKSILDVVLEERWLELAFEGHRAYDLFRNDRPLVRNYPGTHSLNVSPVNINQTVPASDNRIIFYIPETERAKNPNLTQNP